MQKSPPAICYPLSLLSWRCFQLLYRQETYGFSEHPKLKIFHCVTQPCIVYSSQCAVAHHQSFPHVKYQIVYNWFELARLCRYTTAIELSNSAWLLYFCLLCRIFSAWMAACISAQSACISYSFSAEFSVLWTLLQWMWQTWLSSLVRRSEC